MGDKEESTSLAELGYRVRSLHDSDARQWTKLEEHDTHLERHASWITENKIKMRVWSHVLIALAAVGLAAIVIANDGLAGLARILLGK